MFAAFTWANVGKALWALATITIPLPLIVIVAGGLWLWIDTGSRVRTAVDKAMKELVAGAEIDALEAKLDGERRLRMFAEGARDEARRIQAEEEKARQEFSDKLVLSEIQSENDAKEIEDLKKQPRPEECVADDAYIDGLRNK